MNETESDSVRPDDAQNDRSLGPRLKDAWVVEFNSLRWRLLFCSLFARFIPEGRAPRLRAWLVRGIGVKLGAGTRIYGMPTIQSSPKGPLGPRLRVGKGCTIGTGVILEFGAPLVMGDRVSLENDVVVLTTTHQIGPKEHRAGTPVRVPVMIGSDVSVGVGAIILPGTTISDGATVLPRSVVNANVASGVTVGGVPARPVRSD
jgi:maltose O-acetyltransferase